MNYFDRRVFPRDLDVCLPIWSTAVGKKPGTLYVPVRKLRARLKEKGGGDGASLARVNTVEVRRIP